ncbi:hypothetical protein ACQY0O_006732 [Thecaphora frezii]
MGFNKKLLVAGLAVGVTAYMLYRTSKKKQQQHIQASQPYGIGAPTPPPQQQHQQQPQQHQQNNNNSYWGAAGAAAGLATAGAAYAAYHHHQSSQQQQHHHYQQQQAPYGAPASADVSWEALRDWRHIANILSACVEEQFLYPFWTFDSVARLATHIATTGSLVACADAWQLPPFLAQDLVKLALFDVMFLLDDSASMRSEHKLRPDALKGILRRAADAAGRFDQDGMECAWMNSDAHQRIHTADDAARFADACKFNGGATPMGASLESKLLVPSVLSKATANALQKPVLVIVITDGRPTGSSERGEKIVQVLKQAKRTLESTRYGEDAINFQIAAVGNDRDAQEWLDSIDSHPEVGEMIDVCSDIRHEAKQVKRSINVELTEELYCLKILLGGIDASYDASDEPGHASKHRDRNRTAKEARFDQEIAAFRAAKAQALGGAAAPAGALPNPAQASYGHPGGYPGQPAYGGAAPPQPPAPYNQPSHQPYGQSQPASSYGGGGFPDPASQYGAPPPYGSTYGPPGASRSGDAGPPQPWGGAAAPPQHAPQQPGAGFPAGAVGFGMPTPDTNFTPYGGGHRPY